MLNQFYILVWPYTQMLRGNFFIVINLFMYFVRVMHCHCIRHILVNSVVLIAFKLRHV